MFDGVTWYMQKVLNELFGLTQKNRTCDITMLPVAIRYIIDSYKYTFQEVLFRMPEKQKEVLIAINKEGHAKNIVSANFAQKYRLNSASSIQSAVKVLLEKDFITLEQGEYYLYDKFMGIWLKDTF